jgi:Protein of unknown function VcgC/VcgE (DUF2780)
MTRHDCLTLACVALLMTGANAATAARGIGLQTPDAAATAATKASPELVGALSKELGSTPEQAAGAAGALFGVAKSRLSPEEFSQVSKAVPGMTELLKAAPGKAAVGTSGASGAMSQLTGSAAGLAGAASSFSKLGLKPDMVGKAVPVLTSFVSKSGGADVGKLLAGALK